MIIEKKMRLRVRTMGIRSDRETLLVSDPLPAAFPDPADGFDAEHRQGLLFFCVGEFFRQFVNPQVQLFYV